MQNMPHETNISRNLRVLKALIRISDDELAEATGIKRSTLNTKVNGLAKVSAGELFQFSAYFGLPMEAFFLDTPAFITAYQRSSDQPKSQSGWFTVTAGQAA